MSEALSPTFKSSPSFSEWAKSWEERFKWRCGEPLMWKQKLLWPLLQCHVVNVLDLEQFLFVTLMGKWLHIIFPHLSWWGCWPSHVRYQYRISCWFWKSRNHFNITLEAQLCSQRVICKKPASCLLGGQKRTQSCPSAVSLECSAVRYPYKSWWKLSICNMNVTHVFWHYHTTTIILVVSKVDSHTLI